MKRILEALESTGLPVAYRAWPEGQAPPLPYLCYLEGNSDNFAADGKVYVKINWYRVELYTAKKDPETEALVEKALDGFVWEKENTYIESEKCYQTTYEMED